MKSRFDTILQYLVESREELNIAINRLKHLPKGMKSEELADKIADTTIKILELARSIHITEIQK